MAKNNKYASINFNHIYEKTVSTNTNHHHHPKNPSSSSSSPSSPSPSSAYSSASYSAVSAPNKPHGRILVLTRPTPKPVAAPNPIKKPVPPSEPLSDAISLRPLGRTGTASPLSSSPILCHEKEKDLPSPQPPKRDKFVPPHLRPGFVPREDGSRPEALRSMDNGRPKSGGHERMRRGAPSDAGILGRGGNRPSSSG